MEAIKPEPEPAAAAKKSPTEKKAKVAAGESDEEPEEAEVVTGAMDGFVGATKKTKKKLVEKNFMDDKGYLGELLQVLTPQSVHTRALHCKWHRCFDGVPSRSYTLEGCFHGPCCSHRKCMGRSDGRRIGLEARRQEAHPRFGTPPLPI